MPDRCHAPRPCAAPAANCECAPRCAEPQEPPEEPPALTLMQQELPRPEMAPQVSLLAAVREQGLRGPVELRPSPELALAPLRPSPRRQSRQRRFEWAQSALR